MSFQKKNGGNLVKILENRCAIPTTWESCWSNGHGFSLPLPLLVLPSWCPTTSLLSPPSCWCSGIMTYSRLTDTSPDAFLQVFADQQEERQEVWRRVVRVHGQGEVQHHPVCLLEGRPSFFYKIVNHREMGEKRREVKREVR